MDFELSDEQKMLVEMCHDFAVNEIRPVTRELDKIEDAKETWSWDLLKKASKLGLRTCGIPEEFGGGGLDLLTMIMMWDELSWGDGGFPYALTANTFIGYRGIDLWSKELRDLILPKVLEDDTYLFALSVSEPRGMTEVHLAYEPGGVDSYAERNGDEYIINGTKAYCSGGPVAKAIEVMVRIDKKGPFSTSTAMFMLPLDTPGFSIGKIHDYMGFRTLITSELALEDVHVPASFRIGGENRSAGELDVSMRRSLGYPLVPLFKMSVLLGVMRALYDEAVNYARTRVVCGEPIIQHDPVKIMLAEMKMKIEAGRAMARKIAWNIDHHPERAMENFQDAVLFKGYIGDIAPSIIKNGDEVLGGLGTNKDMLSEKLIRDIITFLHGYTDTHIALMLGAPTLEP